MSLSICSSHILSIDADSRVLTAPLPQSNPRLVPLVRAACLLGDGLSFFLCSKKVKFHEMLTRRIGVDGTDVTSMPVKTECGKHFDNARTRKKISMAAAEALGSSNERVSRRPSPLGRFRSFECSSRWPFVASVSSWHPNVTNFVFAASSHFSFSVNDAVEKWRRRKFQT